MKLATVFGAWFSNKAILTSPRLLCSAAVAV